MAPLLNFQPATGGGRALVSVKLPIYIDTMYLEPKGQRLRLYIRKKFEKTSPSCVEIFLKWVVGLAPAVDLFTTIVDVSMGIYQLLT